VGALPRIALFRNRTGALINLTAIAVIGGTELPFGFLYGDRHEGRTKSHSHHGVLRGIGHDLAQRAAEAGHAVAATARRPESLADLSAALKLQLDVRDPWSIKRAVDAPMNISAASTSS